MKNITIQMPAKVNFTLDVTGQKNGYHTIKSLVASIDIFDAICVAKRQDNRVTLCVKGNKVDCELQKNTAYIAGKAVVEEFGVNGVDIILEKNIPAGGGLGGSSCDIVGVVLAMKELYGITESIEPLLKKLGSDTLCVAKGGWMVMEGFGETITPLNVKKTIYLIVLNAQSGVSAMQAYRAYDDIKCVYVPTTDNAVKGIESGDFNCFGASLKNDLYAGSKLILPEIESNLHALKDYGSAVMTGSGSSVIGVYDSQAERDAVYDKLFNKFGNNMIKAKTI